MISFFHELKRRKVYRVAVAYIVAAAGIIQLVSAVFPVWDLPNWSQRLVIGLLLAGFPIALILAWAFDLTPAGIEVTRVSPEDTARRISPGARRRNVYLLAAFGLVIAAVAGFFVLPRVAAKRVDKSIAILPFENFSDDKNNAYFADGIQDDILTTLAKISDLKVISRTSVMAYRGSTRNVREIGKALGAAAILEGSVRSDGNRVRVNVQLINATNDEHIWANEYDRDLKDVFALQANLAHEIATALEAKLSPNEKAQMENKPTQNNDAYLLYVRAHDAYNRADKFPADLRNAEDLFRSAVQLDPSFALAFAGLSQVESWVFHSSDPTPERRKKAREAADEAVRLQPNLPEARLALGYCYYYGDRDYERALAEFALAQRGLPNDSETYLAIGAIERRQGKWKESTANLEKATSLNPRDTTALQNLAINYAAMKNYEAADHLFDRGLAIDPHSFSLRGLKAKLAIEWKGDLSVLQKYLAQAPPGYDPDGVITLSRVSVLMYQRRFSEALTVLQNAPADALHGENFSMMPKSMFEGAAYSLLGDKANAQVAFERARAAAAKAVSEAPDDASRHALLGGALAGLGRKEEAIREGNLAAELLPETKDALDGPMITIALAQIYCLVGDKDSALQLIEHSLATPCGLTIPVLRLDPIWDPLRSDPRFEKLLAKAG